MSAAAGPDERLLRAASRRIAVQVALGVLLLLLALATAVFVLDRQAARRSTEDLLRQTSAVADDVGDPPAGTYVVLREPGARVEATRRTPAAAADGQLLPRPDGFSTWSAGGAHYELLTSTRPDGVRVQVLHDTREGDQEAERLATALLLATVLAVPGAALFAGLVGRRAIRPLGDALALQRQFVADASHELRTPLTLLHTRAQLLARAAERAPRADPATGQLQALVRDTRALGDVVEDLLLSAELAHRPAAREVVDLAGLAREVADAFALLAAQSGVRLEVRSGEAATGSAPGAGSGPVLVAGVPTALRRATSALVDNALAHESPGGTVTLTVGADPAAGCARLQVRDGGAGLDPGGAQALFARFARGRDDAGQRRRFGLGLALVQDVVAAHGGSVDVSGAPGEGAAFTLHLPLADPPR